MKNENFLAPQSFISSSICNIVHRMISKRTINGEHLKELKSDYSWILLLFGKFWTCPYAMCSRLMHTRLSQNVKSHEWNGTMHPHVTKNDSKASTLKLALWHFCVCDEVRYSTKGWKCRIELVHMYLSYWIMLLSELSDKLYSIWILDWLDDFQ